MAPGSGCAAGCQSTPPTAEPVPAPVHNHSTPDPTSIVAAIESPADLHRRGILTDDGFATEKAELLGRL